MAKTQPNFSDPRVQARLKHALGFVRGCFSETKARAWSTVYISKFLGQQQHSLGRWLRQQLLIVDNSAYSHIHGKCKEYRLNLEGYEYVKSQLTGTKPADEVLIKDYAVKTFEPELITKEFKYNDKSNRLWHPLQNVRKQSRSQLLAEHGMPFQYDIQCCAPTLILQYSQMCGNDLYLFALNQYLEDRQQIRERIARDAELPVEVVKVIINALFNGAQLGHNPTSSIYQLLNGDSARIEFLKQDPYIIELRADIKTCWIYIQDYMPRKSRTTSKGNQKMIPINSRQKWSVYFDRERRVINSVRTYLDRTNNKYFLEHDGWTCMNEVDKFELEKQIKSDTNHTVRFEITTYPVNTLLYNISGESHD